MHSSQRAFHSFSYSTVTSTGAAGRRRSAACNGMPVAAAAAAVADTGWLVNAHARVGILVVSDRRFLTKDCQLVQLASLRAYAQIHGYAFHLLQPNETAPTCRARHDDFFFSKHCVVHAFLGRQTPGYTALVLDGDNVAASPGIPLDRWIGGADADTDVILYQREWTFEITAGNYFVRNTEFGRQFVLMWSRFEYGRPTGFSSSDNGAVQLALLQTIGLAPALSRPCHQQYYALTDKTPPSESYIEFLACAVAAFGPARRWRSRLMPGTVTLLNRWMGPSVDGLQLDCADTGILPFHHGMKSMNNSCARKYGFEFKVSGVDGWRRDGWSSCMEDPRCAVRRRDPATVPRARALLKLSRKESTATSVISGLFAPIPRFDLGPCIAANMSCDPLDDDPALPAAEVPYRSAFDYEATWRVGEAAAAQWPPTNGSPAPQCRWTHPAHPFDYTATDGRSYCCAVDREHNYGVPGCNGSRIHAGSTCCDGHRFVRLERRTRRARAAPVRTAWSPTTGLKNSLSF